MEAFAAKPAGRPPERIGAYRVLRQLSGTGGLQVYLAHEDGPLGFSRDVILKVASQSQSDESRDIKELGREALACAKLNHPGIVRTHHFFEHEDALVLVLEHVDGVTLGELSLSPGGKERRLDDDAAFHVGISVLEALAHAHAAVDDQGRSAPVVHRAVSPSNILVGRDGVVKLGGFGFAKTSGAGADTTGSLTWEPAYMAPEQVSEQHLTPKVDVYAAGLILWELLTGRPATILPKDPLAIEGILRAVTRRKPEPLANLRRDLPKELVAAVDAALTFAPDERTITCAEMARWMRKVVHVGQAKVTLGARVRALLAAAPAIVPGPAPPVSMVSPVALAQPIAQPKASSQRERTLMGVAPPSAIAQPRAAVPVNVPSPSPARTRPLPSVPIAPPARPAELPPPPIAVSVPVLPLSAPPMEGPPIQSLASVELPRSIVEQMTDALSRPSFFETLKRSMTPRSLVERLGRFLGRPLLAPAVTPTVERPSLIDRLKAPTPWPRTAWLIAWILLGLGLVTLIVLVSATGPRARAESARENAAVLVEPPAASVSPPVEALPIEPAPIEQPRPVEPAKESSPEPVQVDSSPEGLARRGLGLVTVHSAAGWANVYVIFTKYGKVEQPLPIPCGRRFISVGVPSKGRPEPIWLAPGKMTTVPCGGSLELTINPRALRSPAPSFNPTQL